MSDTNPTTSALAAPAPSEATPRDQGGASGVDNSAEQKQLSAEPGVGDGWGRAAARELRMGVTHAIATPEFLAAHEDWERAWAACANLKRKYQPECAPLDEWSPLAEACEVTAKAAHAAWCVELRRQRALDANAGTI